MSVPGEVMAHGGSVRGLHRDAMTGILPEMIRDRRDKGDATAFTNAMTADAIPSVAKLFSDVHLRVAWVWSMLRLLRQGSSDSRTGSDWLMTPERPRG